MKPLVVMELADLVEDKNLFRKTARNYRAKDFLITGDMRDTTTQEVYTFCVLISETLEESEAMNLLKDIWQETDAPWKIFAWLPLNDIKESVIVNLEKKPYYPILLGRAMALCGVDRYLKKHKHHVMKQLKDIFGGEPA